MAVSLKDLLGQGTQKFQPGQDAISGLDTAAGYENIVKALKQAGSLPGMTETALPSIMALLSPESASVNPYVRMLEGLKSQDVAASQTDAMRRGLTVSSIEAGGMAAARDKGNERISSYFGGLTGQLAQMIQQMFGADIGQQQMAFQNIAQAMGQELTSRRDMEMFRKQLEENMAQAARNRKASLWGAGIGAAGSVAGGALAGGLFSDERLKKNITWKTRKSGVDVYSWEWNSEAKNLGLKGKAVGVMADQIAESHPHLVSEEKGFKKVDYSGLPASVKETLGVRG